MARRMRFLCTSPKTGVQNVPSMICVSDALMTRVETAVPSKKASRLVLSACRWMIFSGQP